MVARSFSEISTSETSSSVDYLPPTKMSKVESSKSVSESPETRQVLSESKVNYVTCDEEYHESDHSRDTSSTSSDTNHETTLDEKEFKSNHDTHTPSTSSNVNVNIPMEKINAILQQLDPYQNSNIDMSPDVYVQKLFETIMGFQPMVRPTLDLSSPQTIHYESSPSIQRQLLSSPFIPPISEEDQENYSTDVVSAVRENDLHTLQSFHSNGRSLSCCNRFGESLLHMACRRGFDTLVLYLIQDASVSIRISDDCGRTPLHDGLWHKECQYAIMDLLVRTDPLLLLTCDKRGHTPFCYARKEHWGNWRQFLWDRREHMRSVMRVEEMELFRSEKEVLS